MKEGVSYAGIIQGKVLRKLLGWDEKGKDAGNISVSTNRVYAVITPERHLWARYLHNYKENNNHPALEM